MKRALLILTFVLLPFTPLFADDAWNAVKTYRYGDDFKPLLAVEADVLRSAASPETKTRTAARLAALLSDETTPAGRQFVCMQLRLIGGPAEVPKLAEYLNKSEDVENARMALTDIRCEESLVPLRKALETFKGRELTGIIGSLAARDDKVSIPALAVKLDSDDPAVAAAAAAALGRFGTEGLQALKKAKSSPTVDTAIIGIADKLADDGKTKEAEEIFTGYSDTKYPAGIRRAAFRGLLRLLPEKQRKETIEKWFLENDRGKNDIAGSCLTELPEDRFAGLSKKIGDMTPRMRIVYYEAALDRNGTEPLESLIQALQSDDEMERLTAIQMLRRLKDASTIPLLLDLLEKDKALQSIVKEALSGFPPSMVGPKLLEAIRKPSLRSAAIDVIVAMKYYDAIDPMIPLAKSEDVTLADPVIDGLGRLCDPDNTDLSRMLELYLTSRPGAHREKVERAIVVVCEKLPDPKSRADQLITILEKRDGGLSRQVLVNVLPLLGKVGNCRVAEMVRPLVDGKDAALRQAAVRSLCNWPNAEHMDDLWDIASKNPSKQYQRWALRAFVRVVTLKSDRPEAETLSLLKKTMEIAAEDSDRQWCLSRAATVRTMDSVEWAASYLDDPVLSQTACLVLVELAHHRFLREPNKDRFVTILLKVERTAKEKDIVERAKKSRLGM